MKKNFEQRTSEKMAKYFDTFGNTTINSFTDHKGFTYNFLSAGALLDWLLKVRFYAPRGCEYLTKIANANPNTEIARICLGMQPNKNAHRPI